MPSSGIEHESIEKALVNDLEFSLKRNQKPFVIKSVYFGGGTPSLARPQLISTVLETIARCATMEGGVEVTLEANPTEAASLEAFRDAGVDRVSLGVQSLSVIDLRFMGRDHSVRQSLVAIEAAKKVFRNVSLDFISARPGQTVLKWSRELEDIVALDPNHLSIYQLTVERGTPLFSLVQEGKVVIPDNELLADLFEYTQDYLSSNGFEQYEVSSYSRDGDSRSIHNQNYWKGLSYIGVGPGAHGRVRHSDGTATRTYRINDPKEWISQCLSAGNGIRRVVGVSQKDMNNVIIRCFLVCWIASLNPYTRN